MCSAIQRVQKQSALQTEVDSSADDETMNLPSVYSWVRKRLQHAESESNSREKRSACGNYEVGWI